jgi:hypothetical protein
MNVLVRTGRIRFEEFTDTHVALSTLSGEKAGF